MTQADGRQNLVCIKNKGVEKSARKKKIKIRPEKAKLKLDLENQPKDFYRILKLTQKLTELREKIDKNRLKNGLKNDVKIVSRKKPIKNPPRTLEQIRQRKLKDKNKIKQNNLDPDHLIND